MKEQESSKTMSTNFDLVINRRGTGSVKWKRYPDDVLPMWVADMDFPVAPGIVEAMRRRLDHPIFGYGVREEALKERIVAHLMEKFAWRTTPDDIVLLPGVVSGVNMALTATTKPGDGVLVQTPVYPPILSAPNYWGLNRIELELTPGSDDTYTVDLDAFRAKAAQAKAFLLCNPHNPVGKVFTRPELEAMAAACLDAGAVIVSDEIHCDFVFDGRTHIPIAALDEAIADRCITLMAPSKTYNIAGMKTSFAVVRNPELRAAFLAGKLGLVDTMNVLGFEAALASFTEGAEWLGELMTYLQANRDYLMDAVRTRLPGLSMRNPEGTFLAWIDCSGCRIDGEPHQFFIDHAKVAMNRGTDFGAPGADFVRLNFGCPRSTLEEGIRRIEESLASAGIRLSA